MRLKLQTGASDSLIVVRCTIVCQKRARGAYFGLCRVRVLGPQPFLFTHHNCSTADIATFLVHSLRWRHSSYAFSFGTSTEIYPNFLPLRNVEVAVQSINPLGGQRGAFAVCLLVWSI